MAHPFVKLKGCPKCHGDVVLQGDIYGPYFDCLGCGTIWDVRRGTATTKALAVA